MPQRTTTTVRMKRRAGVGLLLLLRVMKVRTARKTMEAMTMRTATRSISGDGLTSIAIFEGYARKLAKVPF